MIIITVIVIILSHDQVINAAILEQTFIVEFTVFNQMCTDCQKRETKNYVLQVGQRYTDSTLTSGSRFLCENR